MQVVENAEDAMEAVVVWDQPAWAKLPHGQEESPLCLPTRCHVVDWRAKARHGWGHSHGHKKPITPPWWPEKTQVLEEMALTGCVGRTFDRASMASTATGSPLVLGCHRQCR